VIHVFANSFHLYPFIFTLWNTVFTITCTSHTRVAPQLNYNSEHANAHCLDHGPLLQYSSQVISRVHLIRGMRARKKLARAPGALEELRAKPLESWTIANLPARLLLRDHVHSRASGKFCQLPNTTSAIISTQQCCLYLDLHESRLQVTGLPTRRSSIAVKFSSYAVQICCGCMSVCSVTWILCTGCIMIVE